MFKEATYVGGIAQYNIGWQLPNDIAQTWLELARTSPTYIERYTAKAKLMKDIGDALKEPDVIALALAA